ncbi:hypothetical protein FRC06_009823 [Ceratobasidium sp. 370]|nr:hypothetical protein FRC06_009823 [Ceratobasidium sp. 370]
MKFNSPLPVSVPKECEKATKILLSFVDSRNDGLDGLVPRQVLEQAHGFAIFTVVKAGFLFSARAGSGIVIARLHDGTWSAPSAIGSAGMGVGGQAGAEMTDFLIVLNTRAAVKSFMSAGSLTLGGNMSLAVGPIGRNGGADVALNTKGKVAAMYSYSKTKGLFGGISVEGSIIVERQDANAIAYGADVTSKQLLSGVVPTPPWAEGLDSTPRSTGYGRKSGEITDYETRMRQNASPYSAYGGPSPTQTQLADISAQQRLELSRNNSWKSGKSGKSGSFFGGRGKDKDKDKDKDGGANENGRQNSPFGVGGWAAKFSGRDSDRKTGQFDLMTGDDDDRDPFNSSPRDHLGNGRVRDSFDSGNGSYPTNGNGTRRGFHPGLVETDLNMAAKDANVWEDDPFGARPARQPTPKISTKPGLAGPQIEGVARAIALFDFVAQESGDLSFNKGDVIIVLKKTDSIDDWWTGKLNGKQGIFPANFTEVV